MTHICHIVAALHGGPHVIVAQMVRHQLAAGARVSVVYSPLRDPLEEVQRYFPTEVELVPWKVAREVSLSDIASCGSLAAILRRMKPNLVHMHSSKAGGAGRLVCSIAGIPSVYSPHGFAFLRTDVGPVTRAMFFGVELFLGLLAKRTVASSPGEQEAMRRLPGTKVLVPNGLDTQQVQSIAASAEAALPASGKFRIVVAGRIEAQKNPEFVAELAAASPPSWEWVWVGEGGLRKVLEDTGRVSVTGWVNREAALATVAGADVYLQPSKWEGMSFALLEAMALSRACVVSDAPGNRDVIRSGESGFVCRSPDEYVDVLKQLAEDKTLRETLGGAAGDLMKTRYNLRSVLAEWDKVYRSILPTWRAEDAQIVNEISPT